MNQTATIPPKQTAASPNAHAWASGRASGVPNYFIEGRGEHRITARPRKGTEPQFSPVLDEEQNRSSPERSLAAAVLMQACLDASGRVYPREGGEGGDEAVASEARAFLTARMPSPWARSRQRYTALLGLDDDSFREAVARKLARD